MAKSRVLLDRLLKTRDLAQIVPRLEPEVLHRVIQTCGLEDCAEFVALVTPDQLARIFDLDLWRVRAPGVGEEFDADRFGAWISVLMESGPAVAAEKIIGLDTELVVEGVTRHTAVFDHAAVSSYTTLDGEQIHGRPMDRSSVFEVGGYVLEPRRTSAWEPLVDLLAFLAAEHRDYFHRLMRACVRLSNGPREEDGLHDLVDVDEQHGFDLACGRDARREQQGYVSPAQASAFLRGGRDLQLDADRPPRSAIVRAYFCAIEWTPATSAATPHESGAAELFEVLGNAGVIAPPRALLGAPDRQTARLPFVQAYVSAHPTSTETLAFLANAVLAGCSIQARPFTAREASACAVAICNLGLENWPSRWSGPDLITAFQVGWTILHRDVCLYAAERLIDVLAGVRCRDRESQLRLNGLRQELVQRVADREPWRARHALDVLVRLDAPSWAALRGLIDECPVAHAAVRASGKSCLSVNPTDFEFISENSQIAAVHNFIASLPSVLTE